MTGLKGGVGKTTVTLNLAGSYAARGYRVLVIDVDPTAAATFFITGIPNPGPGETGLAAHVGTVLATFSQYHSPQSRPQAARDLFEAAVLRVQDPSTPMLSDVHRSAWGSVDLLPGHSDCAWLQFEQSHLQDLQQIIDAVEGDYDVILLDAAPSAWAMTLVGLYAATSLLTVTTPTAMSLNSINQLFAFVQQAQRYHPYLKARGVVLNKYDSRYTEHVTHRASLETQLGDFLMKPYLGLHTAVEQAEGAHMPLHAMPGEVAANMSIAFDTLSSKLITKEAA